MTAYPINCRSCLHKNTVYHLDWSAILCQKCKEEIKNKFITYTIVYSSGVTWTYTGSLLGAKRAATFNLSPEHSVSIVIDKGFEETEYVCRRESYLSSWEKVND